MSCNVNSGFNSNDENPADFNSFKEKSDTNSDVVNPVLNSLTVKDTSNMSCNVNSDFNSDGEKPS